MKKSKEENVEKLLVDHRKREELIRLKKNNRKLIHEVERLTKELSCFEELNKTPVNKFPIKNNFKNDSEAAALVSLGDWHSEERVRASTVNGMNKFDLDIAHESINNAFANSITLLKKEQKAIKIDHLIVGLLGDFISGNIHEELLEICQLSPIDAAIWVQDRMYSGLMSYLEKTDCKITVVCCVDNHSRITKKLRHSTASGNSLSTMMYKNLARLMSGEKRIQFIIEDSYHTYLKVYDYTLRFHHGHNIRYQGGVGGITIPVNKAIAQWNKERVADLDVFGHWHQRMYDTGSNKFLSNGSLIGYNAFAKSIKASYEPPSQAFTLIDRKNGKTVTTPIFIR